MLFEYLFEHHMDHCIHDEVVHLLPFSLALPLLAQVSSVVVALLVSLLVAW